MTITANCKFCKVPIVAEAHPDCPELNLKAWLPLLCCNRCGEFQQWLRKMIGWTRKTCVAWSTRPHKAREASRGETHEELQRITRRIAEVVCKFHWIETVWELDFVEQLMERPDRAEAIVKLYEGACRRESLRSRSQPEVSES